MVLKKVCAKSDAAEELVNGNIKEKCYQEKLCVEKLIYFC